MKTIFALNKEGTVVVPKENEDKLRNMIVQGVGNDAKKIEAAYKAINAYLTDLNDPKFWHNRQRIIGGGAVEDKVGAIITRIKNAEADARARTLAQSNLESLERVRREEAAKPPEQAAKPPEQHQAQRARSTLGAMALAKVLGVRTE
jgi:hypothetical protein